MEIQEIKNRLTLAQVLHYYHLKPDFVKWGKSLFKKADDVVEPVIRTQFGVGCAYDSNVQQDNKRAFERSGAFLSESEFTRLQNLQNFMF